MANNKALKKGHKYFNSFTELEQNIRLGKTEVFIDKNIPCIIVDASEVEDAPEDMLNNIFMWIDGIPKDFGSLFVNCEEWDYDEVGSFVLYTTTYDDFCNIFSRLIEMKRLSYFKKQ